MYMLDCGYAHQCTICAYTSKCMAKLGLGMEHLLPLLDREELKIEAVSIANLSHELDTYCKTVFKLTLTLADVI